MRSVDERRGWPRRARVAPRTGRPWPARIRSTSRRVDDVEAVAGTRRRVGRVAEVVVERDARRAGGRRTAAAGARAGAARRARVRGPGVSCTCQVPRSVSTSTPSTSSTSGSTSPRDARCCWPRARRAERLDRLRAARRCGARPRGAARTRPPDRRRSCACGRGRGGSRARSRSPRRSARPGRSGRSGRACRRAAARAPCRRPAWSSASSSWRMPPGSWMPVSTSTMPSPAAIAQALPCGTPGQGSGRRRRQRPGSTLSARASSRLRRSVTRRSCQALTPGRSARRG